ncbi:AsmA-like C-terminal domain-containing protein [Candidatus Mesenet endosymbiont of Phosphuga atrata]|uniref:YhdP family protein n=1 Tax=Candidatus Mesenet endosymbiont of Phosphuga atrata TaxID=3066221 RepID=UPI0030D2F756
MKKVFALLLSIIIISLLSWCTYLYIKDKNDIAININYVNFHIKNKLLKIFPDSQINIHNTKLIWQKSDEKLYLLLEGIAINNQDTTIEIPKVFLFSKAGLAFLFDSSNIALVSVIDPYILLGKKHSNQKHDIVAQARTFFNNMPLWMEIKVNGLIIERELAGKLNINELIIDKQKERNISTISVVVDNRSEDDMLINLRASEDNNHSITTLVEFSNLNIGLLLDSVVPTLSGKFSVNIDKKDKITDGQLSIWKAKGAVKLHSDLEPINLNSANLKLRYSQNVADIQSLRAQIDQTNLLLSGEVNTETEQISLKAQIDKVPAKSLCSYFPTSMNFKDWYCNHITAGDVLSAAVNLETTISDIISGQSLKNIDLKANIKDVTAKFHEDFESINHLDGNISIQNNNLKVAADKAQFQGFTISSGNMEVSNLGKNDQRINIHGNASSDAYELFELFKIKEIAKVDRGHVLGEAKSEFNFNINDADGLVANLASKIDNLSISNDFYDLFVSSYNFDLSFNDNLDIDFKSHGLMYDKPMQLNVNGNYEASNKLSYEFLGNISPRNAKKFTKWAEMDGYVNLNLKSRYDEHLVIEGKADLSELELSISSLGWNNESEDHNIIDFTAEIKDKDDIFLKHVHAYGEDLDIELNGRINNGLYLDFENFKLLNNNLKLQIQLNNDQSTFNISGESIDLSNLRASLGGGSKLRNTKVTMNVDKMIMKNDVVINDADLDFNCINDNYCNGKFSGLLPDGSDVVAEYSKIGLELYADNAGLFLKALNIANTVNGGKLSFYLSSKSENKTAYGMASLSDFYIVRTPILAKILALSSLQGIVNTLNNDGIYFHEFDIPFSYEGGIINIEESWLEGSELGISAIGKANLTDQTFNIKGQIIPAYALNKSIWKIPLLGKLLTGGKSRGVIAVDYKIKGNEQKNDVSVNLISALAPNILKRVLEAFNHSRK